MIKFIGWLFLVALLCVITVAMLTGGLTSGRITNVQEVDSPNSAYTELEIYVDWKPGWLNQLWTQSKSKVYVTQGDLYIDKETHEPVSRYMSDYLTYLALIYLEEAIQRSLDSNDTK